MILLHLFYSMVPRALDTPRVRLAGRTMCVVLLALVVASAVSRGDDTPAKPDSPATSGRGNISIVHVSGTPADAAPPAPAVETPAPAAAPATGEATEGPAEAASSAEADTAHDEHASSAGSNDSGTASEVARDEPPVVSEGSATADTETAHAAVAPVGEADLAADVAGETGLGEHPAPMAPVAPAHEPDEIDAAAESGRRFWQAGEYEAAEKAFTRALTANTPVARKRDLVLEMAGLYRGANELPKAAAVLEKFLKTYPADREVPQVLLRLGMVYRDLGVYSMATARFFQVLNSTLRVSEQDIPEYRKLAMKARLEIAETYAAQGNLTEAEKYFARLQLLDLDPEDRERVLLRSAQMQFTLRQWLPAEKALAAFAASSPDSPHLPEVRYLRAKALEELGRKQEAIDEVVALLQTPASGDAEAARSAAYWKRRCANELANRFYEQGDFLGALSVYQALARASMDPSWRWPAIYQIGLCFERMEMPKRAAEAYDAILAPETAPAAGTKLPEAMVSLQDMARWRRSQLAWIEEKESQLESLASGKPAS